MRTFKELKIIDENSLIKHIINRCEYLMVLKNNKTIVIHFKFNDEHFGLAVNMTNVFYEGIKLSISSVLQAYADLVFDMFQVSSLYDERIKIEVIP